MADYLLDKRLSGIVLNPGKLVQTQTALSADQLFIGINRPLVQGITTICGLDLENIHRFITGQSGVPHKKFSRLGLMPMLPKN